MNTDQRYTVGSRDWTVIEEYPSDCPAKSPDGFYCTRKIGHEDRHVASNGRTIVAVWSALSDPIVAGIVEKLYATEPDPEVQGDLRGKVRAVVEGQSMIRAWHFENGGTDAEINQGVDQMVDALMAVIEASVPKPDARPVKIPSIPKPSTRPTTKPNERTDQ